MRQEFDLRQERQVSQVFIGVMLTFVIPVIILVGIIALKNEFETSFLIFLGILCVFSILEGLFSIQKAEKTHLAICDKGIEYSTPILELSIPWQKTRLIQIRSRYGWHYGLYSPKMIVKRTKLGKYFPANLEKLMKTTDIPISDFLGNDLEEILEVLSAYPEFKNYP